MSESAFLAYIQKKKIFLLEFYAELCVSLCTFTQKCFCSFRDHNKSCFHRNVTRTFTQRVSLDCHAKSYSLFSSLTSRQTSGRTLHVIAEVNSADQYCSSSAVTSACSSHQDVQQQSSQQQPSPHQIAPPEYSETDMYPAASPKSSTSSAPELTPSTFVQQ